MEQNQTTLISDSQDINVLLVGNNPTELSELHSKLSGYQKIRFIVNFCFDLQKNIREILVKKPEYILLDDGLPYKQLKKFIKRIRRNIYTRETPVAILKSDNTPFMIHDVQDYHLKSNFNPERIFSSIRSDRNFRKANIYLKRTLKNQILSWFRS